MEKPTPPKVVLPSEIVIYDILTRVPPLSLVRFRCVCKNWSNLITHDPLFVTLHSQKYDKSASGLIGMDNCHTLIFVDHNDKKETILPLLDDKDILVINIQQSFNGLLVLRCWSWHYDSYRYFVYNPITRRPAFNIPIPPYDPPQVDEDVYEDEADYYQKEDEDEAEHNFQGSCEFCLCYDLVVGKHKVVFCGSYRKRSPIQKIKFLTVGDESEGGSNVPWRDILVPSSFTLPYNSLMKGTGSSICLSDSLYWIIKRDSAEPPYVLGLDISREVFYGIELPEEAATSESSVYLNEMGGELLLSCHDHDHDHETNELQVWTLKKQNHHGYDDHMWVKRFNIDMDWRSMENLHTSGNMYNFCDNLWPLAILRDPPKLKIIFGNSDSTKYRGYYSYDMELNQLETIYDSLGMLVYWHAHSIEHY